MDRREKRARARGRRARDDGRPSSVRVRHQIRLQHARKDRPDLAFSRSFCSFPFPPRAGSRFRSSSPRVPSSSIHPPRRPPAVSRARRPRVARSRAAVAPSALASSRRRVVASSRHSVTAARAPDSAARAPSPRLSDGTCGRAEPRGRSTASGSLPSCPAPLACGAPRA